MAKSKTTGVGVRGTTSQKVLRPGTAPKAPGYRGPNIGGSASVKKTPGSISGGAKSGAIGATRIAPPRSTPQASSSTGRSKKRR